MKKPRVLKSWSKRNVPPDVWPNILSRLPVKSLLRFRAVSNSWKSMIDDPNFRHLHVTNFKNNLDEIHLFIVQKTLKDKKKLCILRSCKHYKITTTFNSLDTTYLGKKWDAIFSADGLVMIHYDVTPGLLLSRLVLWNPSIRKTRVVPNSPEFSEAHFYIDLGFGFDPLINDYKHVRLVLSNYNKLHRVLIYTVGSGEWRAVEFQGDWHWTLNYDFRWKAVCCNGVLYFVSDVGDEEKKQELVSFDLSNEVFGYNCLPVDNDVDGPVEEEEEEDDDDERYKVSDKHARKVVTVLDEGRSLGVFYLLTTSGCIWVLGDSKEWSKRYSFNVFFLELFQEEFYRPKVLYLKKNGDIVFEWFPRQVTLYNLETQDEQTLVSTARGLDWRFVTGYKESLIMLNG